MLLTNRQANRQTNTIKSITSFILNSQVVSLSLQSVMEVANFCAAMDTLIDQDEPPFAKEVINLHLFTDSFMTISPLSSEKQTSSD